MRLSLFGNAAATFALALAGSAFAAPNPLLTPESVGQSMGIRYFDYKTGQPVVQSNASVDGSVVGSDLYDNVDPPSSPNFGYSEPKTNLPTFGDTLNMAGMGTLDEAACSIFNSNSGGNAGNITGGTVDIEFYRLSDGTPIGGFLGNFDLSASPLPAGFLTVLDFQNLAAALATPIVFDTPDIIMTQTFTVQNGTSTRSGVASFNPIDVGSSPDSVFLASTATAPNFYNFNPPGTKANFGYYLGAALTPEPGTLSLLGLAGLALVRNRRKA